MGPQTHNKGQMIRQIATHALHNLLRVLFVAPVVLMACWMFYVGTQRWGKDEYWSKFPPDFGCDDTILLDRCNLQQLLYMWLTPTVLALTAVGLLAIRAILPHESHRSGKLSKLGSYLLPPRQFWLWWCGGITVSDFLAICVWIAINATWATIILKRFWKLLPIFSRLADTPTLELQVQLVAVMLGCLLFPNLVLLFYPVTRGSVVLQAAGLSYPDAIRYHRWLGHAVMVMVTAHSLAFWGIWIYQQQWLKEALDQGDRINNLAGGVSFLSGLALWLSSLEVARRSNYEVFYKLHHIGFWGFTFAGCCHVWSMFWYFLPGLILYGIDGIYRIQQALWEGNVTESNTVTSGKDNKSGSVQILEAAVSRNNNICYLLLSAPRYAVSATGFIWLNIPDVSWHSWHPFEYFAVPVENNICYDNANNSQSNKPGSGSSSSTGLLVHVKAYDRWTKDLIKLVSQQQQQSSGSSSSSVKLRVKVEGPYAELPTAIVGHPEVAAAAVDGGSSSSSIKGHHDHMVDGLIIIAGGVGITAAMSVLQELSVTGAPTDALPTLMIWTCRYTDEFEFLGPRVLAMADALNLNLTTKLYYTGDTKVLTAAAAATPAAAAAGDQQQRNAAASSSSGAGLVTSSMCPVVELQSFWCQTGHKLLLHILAFASVLGAILIVRYYSAVLPARQGLEPWTTGQMGTAYVILISTAILVPGSLLLWITLAAARRTNPSSSSSRETANGKLGSTTSDLSTALLVDGTGTGSSSSSDNFEAAAAPAAQPSAAAAAAVDAREPAVLLPVTAAAGGENKVSWQLHIPAAAAAAAAAAIPVDLGRPSLPQLVSSWLATQRLLPAAEQQQQQQQYDVYGMGPVKLVADVQLLCDNVNKQGVVQMNFVQKTHEL